MLTREENELLTRVGPGTPMGNLMRRYWVPALLSWELPEPDCPPAEVRLLGENLVAFRETNGKVGIVSAYCAHRRVNLFWGRNEESGLRCVYHGWKFDIEGRCVDMPSEPAMSNFKDRVRIPAYPTYEVAGVVFAYMGPPEKKPAPPLFQWTQVPPEQRAMSKNLEECNWLQALEGSIDYAHGGFLHSGKPPGLQVHVRYDDSSPQDRANRFSSAPRIEVVPTDYGFMYGAIGDLGEEGTNFVRGYHWIMPWNSILAQPRTQDPANGGHMWVPLDDENTMVYNWRVNFYAEEEAQSPAGRGGTSRVAEGEGVPIWFRDARLDVGGGNRFGHDVDVENGFRGVRNRDNKYGIDRQVQKTQTYTGIDGINTQDRAVQESMGAIADRTLERLGTTDRAIIHARRSLLQAIKTVQEGADPPGVAPSYYSARAYQTVLPKDVHWFEAMRPKLLEQEENRATAAEH